MVDHCPWSLAVPVLALVCTVILVTLTATALPWHSTMYFTSQPSCVEAGATMSARVPLVDVAAPALPPPVSTAVTTSVTPGVQYLALCPHGRLTNRYMQLTNGIFVAYLLNRTVVAPSAPDNIPSPESVFDFSAVNALFGRRILITKQQYLIEQAGSALHPSCRLASTLVCRAERDDCSPQQCSSACPFWTDNESTNVLFARSADELTHLSTLSHSRVALLTGMTSFFLTWSNNLTQPFRRYVGQRGWSQSRPDSPLLPWVPDPLPAFITYTSDVWLTAVRLWLYIKARIHTLPRSSVPTQQCVVVDRKLYMESRATVQLLDAMIENERERWDDDEVSPFRHLRHGQLPAHYAVPSVGVHVRRKLDVEGTERSVAKVNLTAWRASAATETSVFVAALSRTPELATNYTTTSLAMFIGTNGNTDDKRSLLEQWPHAVIECPCSSLADFAHCRDPELMAAVVQAVLLLSDHMLAGTYKGSTFTALIKQMRMNRTAQLVHARQAVLSALHGSGAGPAL